MPEPARKWFEDQSKGEPDLRRSVARWLAAGAVVASAAAAYCLVPRPTREITVYLLIGAFEWLLLGPVARVFSPRSERMAISVGPRGLTVSHRTRRAQRYSWESVQRVEHGRSSALLVTSLGDIAIGPTVKDWAQLAETVREHIGQTPPDAGKSPSVAREQLVEWMGGERVVVEALGGDDGETGWLSGCAGVVALVAVLVVLFDSARFGAVLMGLACFAGWTAWLKSATDLRRIEATPEGLALVYVRGRRRIGWHDVHGIGADALLPWWRVNTSVGDIAFEQSASGAPQLAHAIGQILEARHEGQVLPRMSDVSDAAISPVTVSTSPDRGLSPAEGNPPDAP